MFDHPSAPFILAGLLGSACVVADDAPQPTDYLSFTQGAVPVLVDASPELKVDHDKALQVIDGNPGGFVMTPRPGPADTSVSLVFELPAPTRFTGFAVPNVLSTPSPSQTFFRNIEISGGTGGAGGDFEILASTSLTPHETKGRLTTFEAILDTPVTFVRLTLDSGIDVQRDQTFFEFSEIIGHGSQEPVPLLDAFDGKWKGRGVVLELKQDGALVSGCYDKRGDLSGTVSGNILRATGVSRDGDIPSTFVLTVTDDGAITGVRSTNGAPFRLYSGDSAPQLDTGCSQPGVELPGCGSIMHGIQFDYDSARIRDDSGGVLDALYQGLLDAADSNITIVGHTSSEGSNTYNQDLSQRRAEAVAEALSARGIDPERLAALGLGEDQPIADNATEAGRSLNRRVEIHCQG